MKKTIKLMWLLYLLNILYNLTVGLLAKILAPKLDCVVNQWIYKLFDWLDDGKLNNSFKPTKSKR